MNFEEWKKYQSTKNGIDEINNIWKKIHNNTISDPALYLEHLVLRIFLSMKNYSSIKYYQKLDSDWNPINVAPGGKEDLLLEYPKYVLVVEVTQRPILSKVYHFSHLRAKKDEFENELQGLLLAQNINNVQDDVWSTYKDNFDSNKELWHISDVNYLLTILNLDSYQMFNRWEMFLKESKKNWKNETDWELIKNKTISLTKVK